MTKPVRQLREYEMDESQPHFLPGGLRDDVTVHIAKGFLAGHHEHSRRATSEDLANAARGIPMDERQRQRWKRLGLID